MTIIQKAVLVVGAVTLWLIVASVPPLKEVNSGGWSSSRPDWGTALVQGGFWCVTVVAIYFVVGKKK
jgi:hypothetical protein